MVGLGDVLLATAVAVALLMVATWVVSLVLRDASIVDITWGAGFVVVAWTALVAAGEGGALRFLLALMVSAWGLRLTGYLAWRNLGHGEDPRYQAMRAAQPAFPLLSLLTVFALQGALMWVVSLPVQAAMGLDHEGAIGPLAILGVAVWLVGLAFESVGDLQLARFKADPANAGRVMDRGLWRYTRHPNYFGDFLAWWGHFLVAWSAAPGDLWWTAIGPAVMSVLLMRVSGVPLLERRMRKTRPAYADYARRTSAFIPWRPREG